MAAARAALPPVIMPEAYHENEERVICYPGHPRHPVARRALPGWSRGQLRVTRRGRELRVAINPPSLVPGLARLLSVEARADAGPPA